MNGYNFDTSNISNLQSNVDVVGVLETLGLGVSQRRKTKHLSSVLCGGLFVIRANTASCVYCQRLQWQKKGMVGGMRIQKRDGVCGRGGK